MKRQIIIITLVLILGLTCCNHAENIESTENTQKTSMLPDTMESRTRNFATQEPETQQPGIQTIEDHSTTDITFQPVEYVLKDWADIIAEFDSDGELVQIRANPIKDVFTDEVRYYTVFCLDAVEQSGWKEGDPYFYLLFDTNGNLIDKLEGSIEGAVGEFLIRDHYTVGEISCGLWDLAKKEYILENVAAVEHLNGEKGVAVDGGYNVRGLLNRRTLSLEEISQKAPLNLEWTKEGLSFTTKNVNGRITMVVLDENLNPIYESGMEGECSENDVYDCGETGRFFCINDIAGGCIVCVDANRTRIIYDAAIGSRSLLRLLWCDGYRMVIQEGGDSFLCDLSGNKLTKAYSWMGCVKMDDDKSQRKFAVKEGDTIKIIDTEGKSLTQKEIPGLIRIRIQNNMIVYSLYGEENDKNMALQDRAITAGIMDGDFTAAAEFAGSPEVSVLCSVNSADYFWVVEKKVNEQAVSEIYNRDFQLVISEVSLVGNATKTGIAIQKGDSIGVIDYHGNWLTKYNMDAVGLLSN